MRIDPQATQVRHMGQMKEGTIKQNTSNDNKNNWSAHQRQQKKKLCHFYADAFRFGYKNGWIKWLNETNKKSMKIIIWSSKWCKQTSNRVRLTVSLFKWMQTCFSHRSRWRHSCCSQFHAIDSSIHSKCMLINEYYNLLVVQSYNNGICFFFFLSFSTHLFVWLVCYFTTYNICSSRSLIALERGKRQSC